MPEKPVFAGLPTVSPTLTCPTNLSPRITVLIGREHDLETSLGFLSDPRLVLLTLTGPGGIGKTRLAIAIGLRIAGVGHPDPGGGRMPAPSFPDGVFIIPLAPLGDTSLVAATIGRTLGLREVEGRPIAETLIAFLRDKAVLLILDNFEHLLGAAPVVTDLLTACPALKILVTSRSALRLSGEHEWSVPPLAVPPADSRDSIIAISQYPAVALFSERAAAVKSGFTITEETAAAVTQICHRLDGLPLAIELAAARIRILSPQALLSRLDQSLNLLTGGARDLPARQRTLRTAIAWSYDLLEQGDRTLLRRLAVFVGGCSIEAAEAVCNGGGGEAGLAAQSLGGSPRSVHILDRLSSLVEKSLLKQEDGPDGEPRFSMLETIREFALEQLEASGEAELVRRRHGTYFLSLAEEAGHGLRGAEQARWLKRLEAELGNLRVAQVRALATAASGIRLMEPLFSFWWLRGHTVEGRRWLRELLSLPDAAGRTRVRARALQVAGALAWGQTDFQDATALLEESVAIWRALPSDEPGVQEGLAYALVWLALALADNRAAGSRLAQESLALFREGDDEWGIAFTLLALGLITRGAGEEARARVLFEQSRDAFQTCGDRWWLTIARFHLGRSAFYRHDYATAGALWRETLPVFHEYGDKHHIAGQLNTLGQLAQVEGDAGRAAQLFAAEEMVRETFGIPLSPSLRAAAQHSVDGTRVALGEEAFGAAWAAGRAMSLEQSIAYALDAGNGAPGPENGSVGASERARDLAPSAAPSLSAETSSAAGGPPDGLTTREIELLRLLATGLSNQEIAAQLVISLNTVQRHINHIFSKTGAANRTQAVIYAHHHGLGA